MKVTGNTIWLLARVNSTIKTEMFMMDVGIIIKQTEREYTQTSVAPVMKVNGKMISSMAMESKFGQRVPAMKENIICPRKRDLANTPTQMDQLMMGIG